MNEFLLVKFQTHWRRGINIHGFRIFTPREWVEFQKNVPEHRLEWYFGDDELLVWNSKNEYLQKFETTVISSEEVKCLEKLAVTSAGYFPDLTKYLEEDEEGEEDEPDFFD